jgi:hypothetical protein
LVFRRRAVDVLPVLCLCSVGVPPVSFQCSFGVPFVFCRCSSGRWGEGRVATNERAAATDRSCDNGRVVVNGRAGGRVCSVCLHSAFAVLFGLQLTHCSCSAAWAATITMLLQCWFGCSYHTAFAMLPGLQLLQCFCCDAWAAIITCFCIAAWAATITMRLQCCLGCLLYFRLQVATYVLGGGVPTLYGLGVFRANFEVDNHDGRVTPGDFSLLFGSIFDTRASL